MMRDDDRVLVVWVPSPADFRLIEQQQWYRIPVKHAPVGMHSEWLAFYFGRKFGAQKYAIHTYARNRGHELVSRKMLFPNQPNHPRADDWYYKLQLGPVLQLADPIVSIAWRRLLFVHTTGDRFQTATEVRDLVIRGENFVNRASITLREDRVTYDFD